MTVDVAIARDWPRVKWTRAVQVAALLAGVLDVSAVAGLSPAAAFARLREGDPVGATQFVAQCLPRMDAAQWLAACLALDGPPTSPALAVADKAVRRWVGNPSEEARRIAFEAGDMAGFSSPQGAACLAIFLSGGSMAPPTQEAIVNPPPGAFGRAVAAAVLLTAHAQGALAFPERIGRLHDLADSFAAGERGRTA